jgi:hypothetical protein
LYLLLRQAKAVESEKSKGTGSYTRVIDGTFTESCGGPQADTDCKID